MIVTQDRVSRTGVIGPAAAVEVTVIISEHVGGWGGGGGCIVCEVSSAGDGGPIARRDLGLNQVGVRRGE